MRKSGKRKISAGTVAVLLMTMAILGGTVFVWLRLSSGKTVDLSRLKPEVEILQVKTGNEERIPEIAQTVMSTPIPVATQTPEPNNPEKNDPEPYLRSFTLTAAGTVSVAGEVRKNSYSSDAKQYDYSDTMALLKKELVSDLNIVFTENLYSTENKPTDLIAPDAAAAMLKSAGFNAAACGYSKAFDKGEAGIASTRRVLEDNGIRPVGIYENDGEDHIPVFSENGIRTALLQYTDTIPAATRKTMTKNGLSSTVPAADTEAIATDIARARELGCEAVIVLLNWGKTGRGPDKNMKKLVQGIADAGADLIVGSGNRTVRLESRDNTERRPRYDQTDSRDAPEGDGCREGRKDRNPGDPLCSAVYLEIQTGQPVLLQMPGCGQARAGRHGLRTEEDDEKGGRNST